MSQATITLPTGPGILAVALTIQNVGSVNYDFDRKVLAVAHDNTTTFFDYSAAVTVTMTISGVNTTVTVSS